MSKAAHEGRSHSGAGHLRHLVRDLLLAVFVAVLLVTGKTWFERTPDGEALQFLAYDRQQREAASHRSEKPLPIAVVDIGALGPVQKRPGDTELITPRGPLLTLLRELANSGAAAIAVDVDFSRDRGAYVTPEDPRFFHECLDLHDELGRKVPAFLGVRRALSLPPAQWLGGPEVVELVAHAVGSRDDKRKMADWIRSDQSERLYGLAARLARAYSAAEAPASHGDHPAEGEEHGGAGEGRGSEGESAHPGGSGAAEHGAWPHWFAEQFVERSPGRGLEVSEFIVDYAPLEDLVEKRVRVGKDGKLPAEVEPGEIAGKMVLVGYATPDRTTDMTRIPGRPREYPGVFTHACAAYTLVEAPFYELSHGVRLALDALLAAVILLIVFGVRFYYSRKPGVEVATHRIEAFVILGLVVLVWLAGSELPIRMRLIWTDYVLVVGALLLHPYAGQGWEWLWESIPDFFRRVFLEKRH